MTRKDYIVLASKIKSTKSTYSSVIARDIVDDLALALAEGLREDNSRFDLEKWLTACNYTHAPIQ